MATNKIYAKFSYRLLHPRYWLTWLGIGLLYVIVSLPYPVIHFLGIRLGRLSMRLMKRRTHIARRNLELCFPDKSAAERETLLVQNFESTGMGLLETGMAWFWSNKRILKWFDFTGVENVLKHISSTEHQRGIVLLGMHFLTLELGARAFGLVAPGIGVYRPNDNLLMDWLQTWGRLRTNKYMLNRHDVKGMIRALKNHEILWYAPDHDYGPKNSVFVPFFAVEKAATTIGTSILMRMGDNPAIVPFLAIRKSDASGYILKMDEEEIGFPMDDEVAAAAFMNKIIEKNILLAPEQYMWLHRRFKTRPPGEVSLY